MLSRLIRMTKNLFTDPLIRFHYFNKLGILRLMSDEKFLQKEFPIRMGYPLDLESPKTFNEKIQWLKIHDRNPIHTEWVDKYEVRKYIADWCGEEHLIPLLGGPWDRFDEIDFDSLPDRFVLKCTHNSGGIAICTDKSKFDIAVAREKINAGLKENFFWAHREWPYKDVKPRIIAEAYMEDENATAGLTDYKFFCYGKTPKLVHVSDGMSDHSQCGISYFDLEGNRLPFHRSNYPTVGENFRMPDNLAEMTALAARIAEKVDRAFVRVDLYSICGKIYFSEITLFPSAGLLHFEPKEWDRTLGDWMELEDNLSD